MLTAGLVLDGDRNWAGAGQKKWLQLLWPFILKWMMKGTWDWVACRR
jgi:hypothetical protein